MTTHDRGETHTCNSHWLSPRVTSGWANRIFFQAVSNRLCDRIGHLQLAGGLSPQPPCQPPRRVAAILFLFFLSSRSSSPLPFAWLPSSFSIHGLLRFSSSAVCLAFTFSTIIVLDLSQFTTTLALWPCWSRPFVAILISTLLLLLLLLFLILLILPPFVLRPTSPRVVRVSLRFRPLHTDITRIYRVSPDGGRSLWGFPRSVQQNV